MIYRLSSGTLQDHSVQCISEIYIILNFYFYDGGHALLLLAVVVFLQLLPRPLAKIVVKTWVTVAMGDLTDNLQMKMCDSSFYPAVPHD